LRPRLLRGSVQDGIDELMPIRRAKLLGQLHRFCERYAVRQFGMRLQFMQAQPENGMLDGVEFPRRDLAQSGQAQIQRLSIWGDAFDQFPEVFQVDPIGLRILSELLLDVLPRERIDLNLIERLQRQSTRETAGPMGRGLRSRNTQTGS
jgi:hypothetical protein